MLTYRHTLYENLRDRAINIWYAFICIIYCKHELHSRNKNLNELNLFFLECKICEGVLRVKIKARN